MALLLFPKIEDLLQAESEHDQAVRLLDAVIFPAMSRIVARVSTDREYCFVRPLPEQSEHRVAVFHCRVDRRIRALLVCTDQMRSSFSRYVASVRMIVSAQFRCSAEMTWSRTRLLLSRMSIDGKCRMTRAFA